MDMAKYRLLALVGVVFATGLPVAPAFGQGGALAQYEPILPLPETVALDRNKVALGERLFHDPRLAQNNALACASCHHLSRGGADGRARSITNSGAPDVINTLTVFNAAFNIRTSWRGEFRTLEEQTEADLHNPRHANTSWEELLPKLKKDAHYATEFARLYPAGIARASVLDAIATFERSLVTPNSRFDQYLRGRQDALSAEEKRGYAHFKNYGCVSCHQGMNIGGNLFQKIGIFKNYFAAPRAITPADLGRFTVTQDEADRHVFRVPSLRNVALTAPYFHDGSVKTLEQAVALMAENQLGRRLSPADIQLIVKFLRTLTGEYQGKPLPHD